MNETARINGLLKAGFSDWETGGGCKAWGKVLTLKGHKVEIMVTDLGLTLEMRKGPYTVSYEIDPGDVVPRNGQRYIRFGKFADAVLCAIALSRAREICEED